MDFATKVDLAGRLRGLVILLDEQLTVEQCRAVEEHIDADDFTVALEALADRLAADEAPIPDDIRRDFERISSQLGNTERVMTAINEHCPRDG